MDVIVWQYFLLLRRRQNFKYCKCISKRDTALSLRPTWCCVFFSFSDLIILLSFMLDFTFYLITHAVLINDTVPLTNQLYWPCHFYWWLYVATSDKTSACVFYGLHIYVFATYSFLPPRAAKTGGQQLTCVDVS